MARSTRRSALDPAVAGLVPPHPTHYERLSLADETAGLAVIEAAWQACLASRPALLQAPPVPPEPSLPLPGVPQTPALELSAMRLAYAVLRDPARRAVYDAWLAAERAGARRAEGRQRWWRRPGWPRALLLLAVWLAAGGGLVWAWLGYAG